MTITNDKPTYVLGTGLSRDGSACLLKDGKIKYAIEKERVTRLKHDGLNDVAAINYCLNAEGITLNDLDLIVQNTNFGFFKFGNDHFYGNRLFNDKCKVPIITISHHLAHAFNAIGTAPFEDMAVMVMDGCGSPSDESMDITKGTVLPQRIELSIPHLYAEKDSFYLYKGNQYQSIYKDFSPMGMYNKNYPMHPSTTMHSIGGIYTAVTVYCFGNSADEGKLMGLAPYGNSDKYNFEIFQLKDGRVHVNYDWMTNFRKPSRNYNEFKSNFQYYADIAAWTQKEVERAVLYIINSRATLVSTQNLAYSGGVALNAVANLKILKETSFKNVHFTPAAGDNGLSIGCAFYGWLEILKQKRIIHDGNSCFGKIYSDSQIKEELELFILPNDKYRTKAVGSFFNIVSESLNKEKLIQENNKQLLHFNLKDAGHFSLNVDGNNLFSSDKFVGNPTSTINTNAQIILNTSRNLNSFIDSVEKKQTEINGETDLFNFIDVEKIIPKLEILNSNIRKDKVRLNYHKPKDIIAETAKQLANGKIVGWFHGAAEFGPRALGHRSILADPQRKDAKEFINSRVKFREDFRPFAPSVPLEDVNIYFKEEIESPYMIVVTDVKEEWRDKIPAVVHKNNSARVQTVTPLWNEKYYKLLLEFKKITGISVLLNTSFNKKGMPIVETPLDALSFFYECDLDVLILENYMISKH
jgi:predicted NodU family carbamoyl transferase